MQCATVISFLEFMKNFRLGFQIRAERSRH